MKIDIKNVFKLDYFYKVVKSNDQHVKYSLKPPSQILIKNIHMNWLQYIHSKTYKQMPVYINGLPKQLDSHPTVFGCIKQNLLNYEDNTTLEHNLENNNCWDTQELQLDLIFPQQDAMQYFIKWQRYRKYWWSSVSTTPSLFAVSDIKYEDKSANVNIAAQLPDGQLPVENISINFDANDQCSQLRCGISLKNALNILILDGLTNNIKEEYLRLHRKIAPYKISFALDVKDADKEATLKDLATFLYYKLESNKISAWLPNFTLPLDLQIKENLHLGVTYTAIISEDTLKNGIFKLLSSSTMLGEQVHVADFHEYAAVIFDK